MTYTVPPFSLLGAAGDRVGFPGGRPTLLCFVKEDCPTCRLVMPLLAELATLLKGRMDLQVLAQTRESMRRLAEDFSPPFELLDDSDLKVSFAADIDTVPTLVRTDEAGRSLASLTGFVREEWRALVAELAAACGRSANIDWDALPDWRPGCGSLSVDPLRVDRLRAEAENSPLRARRIELGGAEDEFEFLFDQGFSDGLPLVPPTPERVLRMLQGSSRDPQELLAVMPPNLGEVTVEKAAINAVMAGCLPEHLPVVNTVIQAVCTDAYNIHGVMATTMGASPVIVVNGPCRRRLGMNMELGALGQGNRANATIGRAVRLIVRNLGGARPGGTERSTLGNPMKFTLAFAEWEERSPWPPLHVERGFAPEDNVVTVFTMTSGPTLIVDQDSRGADQLAGTLGLALASAFHPRAYHATDCLLVVSPEHVDTLARDGYTKADLRRRIQEVTRRPLRELVADELSGVGLKREAAAGLTDEQLDKPLAKFRRDEDIHIVVAGAEAGKFTGAFHGWATGETGSISVSRKMEEPP